MSDSNVVGYICFNKEDMTDDDKKMVEMYWEVSSENRLFSHTVKTLETDFGINRYDISKLIKRYYGFVFTSLRYSCDMCGAQVMAHSKTDFLSKRKIASFRCEKCEDENKARIERERLEWIEDFENNNFEGSYKVENLTYVEKIFLYTCCIDLNGVGFKHPFLLIAVEKVMSSHEYDTKIMSALVEKGIMYEADNELGRQYFHKKFGVDLECYSYNAYILKSSEYYKCAKDLVAGLYQSISSKKINFLDMSDIKEIVEIGRLSDLYSLLDDLSAKYNIDVERSVKLDSVLRHIGETFTLLQCKYLMNKIAKDVAAYLYGENVAWYKKFRLWTKFLNDYLSSVEAYGWEIYSSHNLRSIDYGSKIESTVSDIFFEELNWNKLSGKDVREKWLSCLTISDV